MFLNEVVFPTLTLDITLFLDEIVLQSAMTDDQAGMQCIIVSAEVSVADKCRYENKKTHFLLQPRIAL